MQDQVQNRLKDQVIVIVGATGGIGSALTRKLAPTGASLVLSSKDGMKLQKLA
ncbi:hypothetical protein [Cylindrospermopsis raciborskii]|uniref:hypothetical protein n=1 Tax=Cylindrospermopsis raciborskii TaxID=77022 RepID=UPI0038CFC9F7